MFFYFLFCLLKKKEATQEEDEEKEGRQQRRRRQKPKEMQEKSFPGPENKMELQDPTKNKNELKKRNNKKN